MDISEKTCIKCGVLKEIFEFRKAKNNRDGYSGKCKLCLKQYNKEYCENNKESLKQSRKVYNSKNKERFEERNKKLREKNKDIKKEYNKIYREENKDKIREQKKKYAVINKEKNKKYQKEYRLKNQDRAKELAKEYYKNNKKYKLEYGKIYGRNNRDKINKRIRSYTKNNINAKISSLARGRIRAVLKNNNVRKSSSSIKLLGCTIEVFKEYLESRFTKEMNWENHGLYGWHIDHITPCSSFDLSDPEQQKQCFHYTNTQPLWATKEIAVRYGESEDYIGNLEKGKSR